MNDLLMYLVKVALCQAALWLFYILFLARGTHFRLNRFFLLATLLLPWLLPLITLPAGIIVSAGPTALWLDTVTVAPAEQYLSSVSGFPWMMVSMLYLGGLLICLGSFCRQCTILWKIRRNSIIDTRDQDSLCISTETISPFSFFGTIYIDKEILHHKELDKILLHERVHVLQRHSLDVIISEIVCCFTWFSPVSWKIRTALKEVHEYLADAGVSEKMTDEAGYLLLLYQSMAGAQPYLANHFNQSLTLKRMIMMTKNRSGRFSMLKMLLVLPLGFLLVMGFSGRNNAVALMTGTESMLLARAHKNHVAMPQDGKTVDNPPQYPGGEQAMMKFLQTNLKYPEAARKAGKQGTVYISFTVTSKGEITDVKVKKPLEPILDEEAIRVVSMMPDWIPGETDGKPVNVQMVLPVGFKLEDKK